MLHANISQNGKCLVLNTFLTFFLESGEISIWRCFFPLWPDMFINSMIEPLFIRQLQRHPYITKLIVLAKAIQHIVILGMVLILVLVTCIRFIQYTILLLLCLILLLWQLLLCQLLLGFLCFVYLTFGFRFWFFDLW